MKSKSLKKKKMHNSIKNQKRNDKEERNFRLYIAHLCFWAINETLRWSTCAWKLWTVDGRCGL